MAGPTSMTSELTASGRTSPRSAAPRSTASSICLRGLRMRSCTRRTNGWSRSVSAMRHWRALPTGESTVAVVRQVGQGRQHVLEGVDDHVLLAGPAAIQRRLAGVGTGRDPLHRQARVADGLELVHDGVEDRTLERLAAAADVGVRRAGPSRLAIHLNGHRSTSTRKYSERLRSQY